MSAFIPGGHLAERCAAIPASVGVSLRTLDGSLAWSHRGDVPFPAASVVKVAILAEVYRQAWNDALSLDELVRIDAHDRAGGGSLSDELHDGVELTLEDLCRLMITVSDNTASNLLLARLGGLDAINHLMSDVGMANSHMGRRFMEPSTPERDNQLTADDSTRLLMWLAAGKLAGPRTEHALDILRRQQFREKIPARLPPEVVVGNKTGELDGVRHDAAIVELPERAYALTVLTDFRDRSTPAWEIDRAIADLSDSIFQALRTDDGTA